MENKIADVETTEEVKEVIIPELSEGKFQLMEHKIKPLNEIKNKDEIELLKEVEFKSESISGGFNPKLQEVFAFVQDDNEILTQAVAIGVVKDSDKLDSSRLFKTAKARFYKVKA